VREDVATGNRASRPILAEVAALLGRVDEEVRRLGLRCERCGRCCDFSANDYVLYASGLERALVVSRYGMPRIGPDGRCSFQAGGLCSIHPLRPLGCRLFFCDPAARLLSQRLHERFLRELKELARRRALVWDYSPFFAHG